MNDAPRADELQLGEDLDFQRKEWKIQRIGWAIMFLIVGFALLGALGGAGPLNGTRIGDEALGLQMNYNRLEHVLRPSTIRLQLSGNAVVDQEVRVWFSREWLEKMEIDSISPEPTQMEAASDRLIYVFALAEPGEPTAITFDYRANEIGQFHGQVGVEGGASYDFQQFIYP